MGVVGDDVGGEQMGAPLGLPGLLRSVLLGQEASGWALSVHPLTGEPSPSRGNFKKGLLFI